MPSMKITERGIRDIPAPAAIIDFWDIEITGLALRAHPTGRKVWILRWRDKGGRRCFEGGGTWPGVKVEAARQWARQILSRAALGLLPDSNGKADAEPASPKISALWAEYEARANKGERRNREGIGRLHVLPVVGDMPVSDLKSGQVDAIVRSLSSKPRTGTAVKRHLHGAYELARVLNWYPDDKLNPAAKVKGYAYRPRTRALSDAELAAVGAAIKGCILNRVFELSHAELITLLLLTGARCGEWKSAEWSNLDVNHPALALSRHKTDAQGVKRIELGPEAWRIIQGLPRRDGNPAIFYGRTGCGRITEATRPWVVVLKRAKVAHCTIHDLRRTFASAARNDGMSVDDVGVLLGHREISVTGIYAIPDLKRRQELIARAEASVLRRMYPEDR